MQPSRTYPATGAKIIIWPRIGGTADQNSRKDAGLPDEPTVEKSASGMWFSHP